MADVIPENTISVLDHGFVRLDDSMASDLSVANAARVSFAKRKDVMDEADDGSSASSCATGTGRRSSTTRSASTSAARSSSRANGCGTASARSTSSRCATRRRPTTSTCPSSRTSAPRSASPARTPSSRSARSWPSRRARRSAPSTTRRSRRTSGSSRRGVARELARSVMPVGAYTEFFWTINARSLMNFISLRAAETAQREIRRYADAVRGLLRGADARYPCGVRGRGPRFPVSALHGVCKGFFQNPGGAGRPRSSVSSLGLSGRTRRERTLPGPSRRGPPLPANGRGLRAR